MTARNVLFLMIAAFFVVALVLIYNSYYKPSQALASSYRSLEISQDVQNNGQIA